MTVQLYIFLIVSVLMSALAQVTLKAGMSSTSVKSALVDGFNVDTVLAVAQSPGVIGGLALYGASVAVWLAVLAQIDVSRAYPFVGLGFLITMSFGYFFLGEPLNLQKILGTLLVTAGVYLVANA
jgi:multidrug transporter EmrE-like cation transporter